MGFTLAILIASQATAGDCTAIDIGDVMAIPPPAVIVLGERRGTQPDLGRASRIVGRLARRGPITLALEAIHPRHQAVLDAFAEGSIDPLDLPARLDWTQSNGFPWQPYQPLVTGAVRGIEVVAAGSGSETAPDDESYPVPGGYMSILRDAMVGYDIPIRMETRFVRTMAWQDHLIAKRALDAWDREGYLVVVVDRTRVEGGKGVAWQIDLAVEEPVHAFVLAWAVNPPCHPGDRVWKEGLLESILRPDRTEGSADGGDPGGVPGD